MNTKSKKKRKLVVSRTRKPEDMSLAQWQIALRRQFGREQRFAMRNLGDEPVFSVFEVRNPQTRRNYRVSIRGHNPGDNHCTCPDFAVNTLGTCKHVEFTLGRLSRNREHSRLLRAGFQPDYSEVYLRYDAQRHVMFRPGNACPPELRKLTGRYFDDTGRLRAEAFDHFPEFLKHAGNGSGRGHEMRCQDDALGYIAQVRDQAALRRRIEQAYPDGPNSPGLDRLLKINLYPYQRQGALFAASAGRALIADDMGLGKTIQATAAVELLACHAAVQRVLVVCPTSLKHQWQQEIARFTDRSACVIEGGLAQRQEGYRRETFYKIVNYDVIDRDLPSIREWSPDVVVLDEAQRIKNWKTRTAHSVKELASPYAIVLTGTPLENRLEELHSIVEFVDRFRLGPAFRFLAEHQHTDETGRVIGYKNLSAIAKTLQPILLRRTRDQVLKDLPPRLDKRLFVTMTDEQWAYHNENKELVARLVAKWRRYHFLGDADQRRLMIALQNMRMSCNSTYLLDRDTDHGVKADELMQVLGDVLEEKNAKVVVFSQWVGTHELIQRRLKTRAWGHVFFHGGVPGPARRGLVDQFRGDENCRLFLSTDAGGVGLNLQHASVVAIMDQPWNPAVLEQRIGRVHRLGQKQPVRVVHFIAQGTIEEGMLGLIAFKKSVFAGALDGGQDEVFLGGTKLTKFMESVERATTPAPAPGSAPGAGAETAMATGEAAGGVATDGAAGGNGNATGLAGHVTDGAPSAQTAAPQAAHVPPAAEAWTQLAAAGMSFLEKLGQALRPTSAGGGRIAPAGTEVAPAGPLGGLLTRDEHTGQQYLKLPMPDPQTLGRLVEVLQLLTGPRDAAG